MQAGGEGHLGPAWLARRVDRVGFGARIELLPPIRSLAALSLQGALPHLFCWRRRRRLLPATSAAEIEVAKEIEARLLEIGAGRLGNWWRCQLGDSAGVAGPAGRWPQLDRSFLCLHPSIDVELQRLVLRLGLGLALKVEGQGVQQVVGARSVAARL